MKTFDDCCMEVKKSTGRKHFSIFGNFKSIIHEREYYREAAEIYAKAYADACIEASLKKAAENAEIDYRGQEIQLQIEVIDSSITSKENHVLL